MEVLLLPVPFMFWVMYAHTLVWGMTKKNPPTIVVTVNVCVEVGLEVRGKVLKVFADIVSDCAIAGSDANKINRTNPATLLTTPPKFAKHK